MQDFLRSALPAFLGFVAGVVGSLIAPWVHWGVEKRKLRLVARRELIDKARRVIAVGSDKMKFREGATYSRIRPFLSERTRKEIESDKLTVQLSGRGGGEYSGPRHYVRLALDDLRVLEQKWKLL